MSLYTEIRKASSLSAALVQEMLKLHQRYFENVRPHRFSNDLAEKDHVILMRDEDGELSGFSTLQYIDLTVEGISCIFLFSGDTIVDEKIRNRSTLGGAFGHVMLRLLDSYPQHACYWLLISKGFRTYRFLPLFFNSFFPAWDRRVDPEMEARLRLVSSHKFGASFCKERGVIDWKGERDRLRPECCNIAPRRLRDPHVAFFLEKNPDWQMGTELVCISEISRQNLNRSAWRFIEKTAVVWNEG